MNTDLPIQMRELGDQLAAEHAYKRCALAYQVAHRIEYLEQKIRDLESILKETEDIKDMYFRKAYPPQGPIAKYPQHGQKPQ